MVRKKEEKFKRKTISYKIKFIQSLSFMSITLLNLADNISEVLHNRKCKKT